MAERARTEEQLLQAQKMDALGQLTEDRRLAVYLADVEGFSYKEIAELVGSPRAVRAVGTACATNPLPVVLPCHRVLRSDGGLGGYIGGLEAKTALLSLEKAA